MRPNYATNVETPRAIGADAEFLDLRFEDGWRLDLERVAAALRDDTQLVSVCVPHNPTGRTMDLGELVALVERHPTARLLVDETYRELAYDAPAPQAAARSERVIAVASLSKAYGLPGLRIGWIACRDRALGERFLAAREQILIAGSLLDETMAARVLARRDAVLPGILDAVRRRRGIVADWFAAQEHFEWHPPEAGVVCFPRLRPERGADPDAFYDALLHRHGTYVGPGHWFEQDRRCFRLGFGWPDDDQLRRGLDALTAAARAAEPAGLEELVQLGHDGVRAGAAQLLGRGDAARHADREIHPGPARGADALGARRDGEDPVGRQVEALDHAVECRVVELEVLVEAGERERRLAADAAVDQRDPLARVAQMVDPLHAAAQRADVAVPEVGRDGGELEHRAGGVALLELAQATRPPGRRRA